MSGSAGLDDRPDEGQQAAGSRNLSVGFTPGIIDWHQLPEAGLSGLASLLVSDDRPGDRFIEK